MVHQQRQQHQQHQQQPELEPAAIASPLDVLCAAGFPEAAASAALARSGGDVQQAAEALLAASAVGPALAPPPPALVGAALATPLPAPTAVVWSSCHPDIDLSEGNTLATLQRGSPFDERSAVCATHAMGGGGVFYAQFSIVEQGEYAIAVGVVPAALVVGRAPQEMADKPWYKDPAVHMVASSNGDHYQGGKHSAWQGMDGFGAGDTFGMLLDLGGGTLTAFKNGARLGVIVPNEKVPSLLVSDQPMFWALDLRKGTSVRIDATKPPPFAM